MQKRKESDNANIINNVPFVTERDPLKYPTKVLLRAVIAQP